MKKLICITALVLAILALMYAEYRYIMVNQHVFISAEHELSAEIFGQIDTYFCEDTSPSCNCDN